MDNASSQIDAATRELRERLRSAEVWDAACEGAAAQLTRALLEVEVPRAEIIGRLRSLGVSRRGAKGLVRAATRLRREEARCRRIAADAEPGVALCPHCLAPVSQFDHFCPKCFGPVTAHASIDPLGQVYSAGRAYRRAASSRPKKTVLVGMWLIFGLQLPLLAYGVFHCVSCLAAPDHGNRIPDEFVTFISDGVLADVIKLVLCLGLFVLYCAILWKVTANYRRSDAAKRKPETPSGG